MAGLAPRGLAEIEGIAYDAVEVLRCSDDDERAERSYRRVRTRRLLLEADLGSDGSFS